ncbi:MAG TPA: flagellar assembly protein FliX [Alphaproteobacteria bacterium]|nr:flagellar assembly protein FliX [Alphaproteobacteria bacterium]
MKVDPINSLRAGTVRRSERTRGSTGAGFVLEGADEAEAIGITAKAPMTAVEALLALQEVTADVLSKHPPKVRANAVLDQLEEVRTGLLLGFIPRGHLERLGRLAEELKEDLEDPKLTEILGEIELRAKVEIAKLRQLS